MVRGNGARKRIPAAIRNPCLDAYVWAGNRWNKSNNNRWPARGIERAKLFNEPAKFRTIVGSAENFGDEENCGENKPRIRFSSFQGKEWMMAEYRQL